MLKFGVILRMVLYERRSMYLLVFVYVLSLCCATRSARDDGSMLCVDVGSNCLFVTAMT